MKPRTYFRLALLFPYILWIVCALIVFILSSIPMTSSSWDIVMMPFFFYAFGILLWFIPYTILAIGMWVWSKGKSTAALYKPALGAPLLLFILMLIEVVLISLPVNSVTELTEGLLSQSAVLGGFSLVFGYLCVGIALGIYKFLKSRNIITEEMPQATSAD
jgi:hypothetical protein